MSTKKKLLEAAAGAAGEATYVDDVFSTYLYTGNGSTQTITNGIDLAGEGGLVWIKSRENADNHRLADTERGVNKTLASDAAYAEFDISGSNAVSQFNSDGFVSGLSDPFFNGEDLVSWTFRKQPGFFDVVTYTGNGTAGRTVSHNLGSVPGMIIIKCTTTGYSWAVYHRGTDSSSPENYHLHLEGTQARDTDIAFWNNTAPTSTEFTVGTQGGVNASGDTYVAYLFAHDAQDFGTDSDEAIIKCDSYTTNASAEATVNLGFEPQWLMIKATSDTGNWVIVDNIRGIAAGVGGDTSNDQLIFPNLTAAEVTQAAIELTPTGFRVKSNANIANGGTTYAYVAIRRPHKPASEFAATDLFDVDGYTGTAGTLDPAIEFPFDTDMFMLKRTDATGDMNVFSRLIEYPTTGASVALSGLVTSDTTTLSDTYTFRSSDAKDIVIAQDGADNLNVSGGTYIYYGFRRAPGFFDVVAYEGDGNTYRSVNHNLGVTPELIIARCSTVGASWAVYYKDATEYSNGDVGGVLLNNTGGEVPAYQLFDGHAAQTSTQFVTGSSNIGIVNRANEDHIAYLFATAAGISKVGTYTGTGSDLDVNCGFSAGVRFVLVKRTDSTGDWYLWDSERGIVAGNDPYLFLNTTAAQVTSTDYIDPLSSGFTITSSAPAALNASGGTYLFLAIA